jgi:hypothetical protein
MIKISTLAALMLITMIGAAQAHIVSGGGFFMPNGPALNGMKLNGIRMNGVAATGAPAVSALAAHVVAIQLPAR